MDLKKAILSFMSSDSESLAVITDPRKGRSDACHSAFYDSETEEFVFYSPSGKLRFSPESFERLELLPDAKTLYDRVENITISFVLGYNSGFIQLLKNKEREQTMIRHRGGHKYDFEVTLDPCLKDSDIACLSRDSGKGRNRRKSPLNQFNFRPR